MTAADDPVGRVTIHSLTCVLDKNLPRVFVANLRVALGSHRGIIAVIENVTTPALETARVRVLKLLRDDIRRAFGDLDARILADPVLRHIALEEARAAKLLLDEGGPR